MAPNIPSVKERFAAYHKAHPAWGHLHLVLEERNVSDGCVRYCIEAALEAGDEEAAELGEILLTMSKTQRVKIGSVA